MGFNPISPGALHQGSRSHLCHEQRRPQLPHPSRTSCPIPRGTDPVWRPRGEGRHKLLHHPQPRGDTSGSSTHLGTPGCCGEQRRRAGSGPGAPSPLQGCETCGAGGEGQDRAPSEGGAGLPVPPAGLTPAGRLRSGCRSPPSPLPAGPCSRRGTGCERRRTRPPGRRCRGDKLGTSPLDPAVRERGVSDGRAPHLPSGGGAAGGHGLPRWAPIRAGIPLAPAPGDCSSRPPGQVCSAPGGGSERSAPAAAAAPLPVPAVVWLRWHGGRCHPVTGDAMGATLSLAPQPVDALLQWHEGYEPTGCTTMDADPSSCPVRLWGGV